jgi:hypothetical protein
MYYLGSSSRFGFVPWRWTINWRQRPTYLCGLITRLLILRPFIGLCKRGSNDKRECNGGFGVNLESQSATLQNPIQEPPSCSP